MKKIPKNVTYAIVAVIVLILIVLSFSSPGTQPAEVSISKVIQQAKSGQIEKIDVDNQKLTITLKNNTVEQAFEEPNTSLKDYGINYSSIRVEAGNPNSSTAEWFDLAGIFLPVLLIIGFFYFMMRQAQGSNNQAMSFGKSRARVFGLEKGKFLFKDVAGAIEAKQELQEIVEFLKYPAKFEALGAKIPKGVLLFGSPGTGKTLLARAVAGEADVPFFSISGSEFVEMFVGVGASRVRDLFAKAKKNAPCIIFIDEIDAVGRQRGTGMGGGHDEREQTLNQILVEMDGFEQGTNVIVMAATNRPDVLDPALLRPGRFDRRVTLDLPDRKARQEILGVHTTKKPLAEGVDLDQIAAKTPGLSGADLANVTNEAAIYAARHDRKKITQSDLNEAVEKVALGPERKSHVLNTKEKEITAFHEAGHAVLSHVMPHADPVHKVSIVSRGMAGGVTWSLPVEDRHYHSVAEFKDDMVVAMGGRVAEELVFGDITTGAESDLRHINDVARRMVTEYGMSPKLSNRVFTTSEGSPFLGRSFGESRQYSENVAAEIDSEVAALVEEAASRARKTIQGHRAQLDAVAKKLIEVETLEGPEFEKVFSSIDKSPKAKA